MSGYIKIYRKLFKNFLWEEKRVYSKFEAWIDLLQMARYTKEKKKALIKNKLIVWGYGEIPASDSFLCDRWGWSKTKLRNFMGILKNESMIEQNKDQSQTIISVCNYSKYNIDELAKEPVRDQAKTSKRPVRDQGETETVRKKKESCKKDVKKSKYGELKNVLLSLDEFQKLEKKFGKEDSVNRIENLSLYIGSNGDKYKSHYATILNWFRKEAPKTPVATQKSNPLTGTWRP